MSATGRGSDQFPLRLPDGLRDAIKADAERNGRSMNAEIVARLEGASPAGPTLSTDDIVWEVQNIAKIIGRTERQTYHMLISGHLPAKQIGDRWVASRRKLLAAILGDGQ